MHDNKEGFVHRLFDGISPGYDLFNLLASGGLDQIWRKRAIDSLGLLPGMRVLDLASGTGDLGLAAARELVPLGRVTACDLSYPMLSLAKRKLRKIPAGFWHIGLTQGKAEALPFADGSFDAAAIAFGMRNVSDLTATFRELHRVVKPGGRLGLLEFGRPKGFFLRMGHALWLSTGVPLLGILTTGKVWPFLYLRRSIGEFLSPEGVLEGLRKAGFNGLEARPLNGGIVYLYTAVKN